MNIEKIRNEYKKVNNKEAFFGEIGIKKVTFHDILKQSSKTSVENLEKIAKYFNKPIGYFFDEIDQSKLIEEAGEVMTIAYDIIENYKEDIKKYSEFEYEKEELILKKMGAREKINYIESRRINEKKEYEFKINQLKMELNQYKNQHIGDNNQRSDNGSNTISNTGNIEGNQNNNHYIGYSKEEMVSVLNERYKIIKNKEKQVDTLLESNKALIEENKHLISIVEKLTDKLLTN